MGSVSLKSNDFQTAQTTVELLVQNRFRSADQNLLVPIALSEATRIRPIGHRLMITCTERDGQGEDRYIGDTY